ncbi:PadR family transcriptional regulator [Archaeoglobus profundus]|uniref:Transcriptional regulator, PadR-like family n=1 Tax=Archaeoglobus profundus (strain DSM 5631 / JCM 9629 / NBRC 100127 / Av18) TaxID=572546 RepID=D2RH25_ARCPA|nr:PadR family transcriptional regulator [Archaeoglobus profundus]ADB57600.1 transcriptional regulator, PadR-like family [Archaeoglobus profundus DSM 5631]
MSKDRQLKGILKLLILKELEKEEATGYDIIKRIGERAKRPSPGSVYPILKELKENGFLNVRIDGRKKIYSLSDKGRKVLREAMEKEKEAIIRKVEVLRESGILSEREAEDFYHFVSSKKEIIMKLHELRNWSAFLDALVKVLEKSKPKAEEILDEFIKRLEDLSK